MPKIVDHNEVRVALAEAYGRVVGAKGFGAATMRAVAREAGCSHSLPLHYFENGNALMTFAFEHQANKLADAIAKIASADEPIRTRLCNAIIFLIGNANGHSAAWRNAIDVMVKAERGSRIADIDRRTYLAVFETLQGLFVELNRQEGVDIEPKAEAALVLTSADGLALASVTLRDEVQSIALALRTRLLSGYGLESE